MFRHCLLALCLAAYSTFANAQNGGADSRVEFRVARFDVMDRVSPVFKAGSPDTGVEVTVPLTFIGGPYKASLREGRFLDLWRGNSEKPEISLPIAENEHKELLLLFIPVEQSFKIIKVLTPNTRMRGGDHFIVNATPSRMAIKLEENKPLLIPPAQSEILRSPRTDDVFSVPVLISFEEQGKWNLASTENWPIDRRFRKYLFAYISPRTRHLAFHCLTERFENGK
jgi:hypothetical protein